MEEGPLKDSIIRKLKQKSLLKQQVFENTFVVFGRLKEVMHELAADIDETLEEMNNLDDKLKVDYRDRGRFEAQIQVADDILIFNMHSDVFEFDRDHAIWQNPYVSENRENSYCGVINIYNLLTDSFKFNRTADEGYLIGRIFVNREMKYFVEGKRQTALRHNEFGSAEVSKDALQHIVETAINYAMDFDLLVPPYDEVKIVNVEQFNTKFENSKFQTGKRLGYKFCSDDI